MTKIPLFAVPALIALSFSTLARAQDSTQWRPLPPPPPPPVSAQAPSGEYVAPLSQQTQPTYVPQSVALTGPRQLTDWSEGDPIPPGYHPAHRARKGLIVGGAVLFGTFYLLSALVAAAYSDSNGGNGGDNSLYVPAVGPFIQMTNTPTALGNVTLAINGAAQTGGLVMLILGMTSPRTILVRNDLATVPLVLPVRLGNDGYGLGVVGQF